MDGRFHGAALTAAPTPDLKRKAIGKFFRCREMSFQERRWYSGSLGLQRHVPHGGMLYEGGARDSIAVEYLPPV